ncbi:MAG: 50S ribosomal protein L15 [Verrucomicrobiales bacterium]|jgi:large subunit ribosomal protein L15|nr:50S ribosomal protein L15 [Verrucomicrobiales bacterium]
MQLHDLKPRPGARNRTKRLGCGESSGHGKTSGRGHKGQRARSGGSVRLGFEGGQWPLYRRIPKRGFNNNAFTIRLAPVNLAALNIFDDGALVDAAALRAKGLVSGKWDGIKILAAGELKKKLTISVEAASEAAKAKITAIGGKLNLPADSGAKK